MSNYLPRRKWTWFIHRGDNPHFILTRCWRNTYINYLLICYFLALNVAYVVEILVEDAVPYDQHSQYHGCGQPAGESLRGIKSHATRTYGLSFPGIFRSQHLKDLLLIKAYQYDDRGSGELEKLFTCIIFVFISYISNSVIHKSHFIRNMGNCIWDRMSHIRYFISADNRETQKIFPYIIIIFFYDIPSYKGLVMMEPFPYHGGIMWYKTQLTVILHVFQGLNWHRPDDIFASIN